MKCTVCKGPATIRMPRHNAHFCETHFISHVQKQLKRVIRHFRMFPPGAKLLLAVSGGKDSMALWDLLLEGGYKVDAVHINGGFGPFSEASEKALREYASHRNSSGDAEAAPVRVYSFRELVGADFETALLAARMPPCSLCGLTKRYMLNRLALEGNYYALVTGHNLDDETAFLLGNLLHGQTGYLAKQQPVLPPRPGFARKVKPLVRLTDRDMELYARLRAVPCHAGACPHSEGAVSHVHKDVLQQIDHTFPGTKGSFYFQFLEKIRPALDAWNSGDVDSNHRRCLRCGYPTRRDGLCQFCELQEKLEKLPH